MNGTNGKLKIPYLEFIEKKAHLKNGGGLNPIFMPDYLFDFQKYSVGWNLRNASSGLFQAPGSGKTIEELVWSENIVRQTNKKVLILTPLAVSFQTVQEGAKFGIECKRSTDGKPAADITVTNYEKIHLFNPDDYGAIVGDEISRIKNFNGKTRKIFTEFVKKIPYRLGATATAAPNDYIELLTISEWLGYIGFMDGLKKFFKNDKNNVSMGRYFGKKMEWRFNGYAEIPFWRYIASIALAMRKPSDLGFSDDGFILPPLVENEHLVNARKLADGYLFELPAIGLRDQLEEQRRTINERCEKAAELCNASKEPSLIMCNRDKEGDYLEKIIDGAVQVSGRDKDEEKEEKFMAFVRGEIKKLVTKKKIGAFGMNFQHCAHIVNFVDNSYEQYYQLKHRCHRYGQKKTVVVDNVTTHGGKMMMLNVAQKAARAEVMFENLVGEMRNAMRIENKVEFTKKEEMPSWL